ncbi:MAG: hypothetical protein US81_C0022G0002 [Parcubacteria group bacterium GW2011_GWE2_38_18]|nr:MAG: hypothetical protein US81_C0022G0002 [Parcubacteria group bacterium GW2011_GWE2_38_18]
MNHIHYFVHGAGGHGCNQPLTPEGIEQTEKQRGYLLLHFLMIAGVIPSVTHGIGECERQMIRLLGLESHPLLPVYIVGDGYHKPIDQGMAGKFVHTLRDNTVILGNKHFLTSLIGIRNIELGTIWQIIHNGPGSSFGFIDLSPGFIPQPIPQKPD